MQLPLMPKATAVWLVDNTSLTFDQIAEFCGLHPLEVKGIADGEVATGIVGQDPVKNGQLTTEEIKRRGEGPQPQAAAQEGHGAVADAHQGAALYPGRQAAGTP